MGIRIMAMHRFHRRSRFSLGHDRCSLLRANDVRFQRNRKRATALIPRAGGMVRNQHKFGVARNQHKLLIYHLTWYWIWLEYRLTLATVNIKSPEERLRIAVRLLTSPLENEPRIPQVDEAALYRIVIAESQKVYLTKNVDEENKKGLFFSYKKLCKRAAEIVREINPEYRYPTALISTVIESSYDQRYFARHLPSLTEIPKEQEDGITEYLTELVFKAIK